MGKASRSGAALCVKAEKSLPLRLQSGRMVIEATGKPKPKRTGKAHGKPGTQARGKAHGKPGTMDRVS